MRGTKYLSELIDCSQFQKNKLNIIKAPTGCGKSYFALQEIPKLTDDARHKIVYLIDTINGKDQIINHYDAIAEYWGWRESVKLNSAFYAPEDKERVVVMTYAKFGYILAEDPDFHKNFDYIICDELHSLIKYQSFAPKPNCHSIAKVGLEQAVRNNRTVVIALSATPVRIQAFFKTPNYEIPVDQESLRQYETCEVIPFTNLEYALSSIEEGKKGLCYTGHISQMIEIEKIAKDKGFHPTCIWSIRNSDHPMNEEQLAVRETILKTFEVPDEYDLLIINSSCETSIKIKSHMDFVIVNSSNSDTQVQVRGRVNADLEAFYYPASKVDRIDVPEEFLGVKLFSEQRNELCDIINLKSPSGRRYSWNTLRSRLVDSDYRLIYDRLKPSGRRYVIITRASEQIYPKLNVFIINIIKIG